MLVTRHQTVWGDSYFYHESANLIADGKGFINPIDWIENHVRIQAADHPPLYLLYLGGMVDPGHHEHDRTAARVDACSVPRRSR